MENENLDQQKELSDQLFFAHYHRLVSRIICQERSTCRVTPHPQSP